MAKKKKQKKAGLIKRQKNRQQKKVSQKRKIQANRPVQKKLSPSKVKQNLKNLPSLIFEPELKKIAFSCEQVESVKEQHEKVPDQIDALVTQEFQLQLKEQLEAMKIRFDQEGDLNKGMMVQAILYFMEQEASPALNQIVVAMYFDALNKIEQEEPTTLKQLNLLLKEYDATWSSYLQEKSDFLEKQKEQNAVSSEPDVTLTEEEESLIAPSPFEDLLEEFSEYMNVDLPLDDETKERTLEDVEVLFNDYFDEKEITQLEEIRPRRVKNFLEAWFIHNMHPTKEDLETMINSLETFFKFASTKDKIEKDKCEEILKTFEDKEIFLSNLNL